MTEEDKKFLEYEQKIYEESAKEIIALYRRCEDKHKSDCDGQDDYLQYSLLRFALKMNISNVFKYTEHIYQRYLPLFFQTRGIKELEVFAPQCEVLNKNQKV